MRDTVRRLERHRLVMLRAAVILLPLIVTACSPGKGY